MRLDELAREDESAGNNEQQLQPEPTGFRAQRQQRGARRYGWYVIQVQMGREAELCSAIERVCEGVVETITAPTLIPAKPRKLPLLRECFSPQFNTRRKYRGEWRDVQANLLPGYVIAVTVDPHHLRRRLWRIPKLTRLLTMGETFVPLSEDERAWFEEFTREGDRTVPISIAHRKGDTLVITQGPLKGREGTVTRVIRKKCLAVVELTVGGKRISTTIGLAVVPEQESESSGNAGSDKTE